jgi:hypothetical protein
MPRHRLNPVRGALALAMREFRVLGVAAAAGLRVAEATLFDL